MKNNKIDSDILDDNYYAEELLPVESIKFHFFKIIGYAILNTTLFIIFNIFLFVIIAPVLFSYDNRNEPLVIISILFLAISPFLYELYRQYKDENLVESNWKKWVCMLSFFGFMFVSYIIFPI